MKNIIFILLTFVTTLTFGQEKVRIFAPSYNVKYANITLEDGIKYKVIQEYVVKSNVKMKGKQYNRFIDPKIDNGVYKLHKVLRVRPLNEDFFNINILLEYFETKNGKRIIIKQAVNNKLKLKDGQ